MASADGGTVRRAHVRPQSRRVLAVLFWTAVVVSVVHYADNYFNYHDYPQSATLPNPSATLILLSWFGFTALGLAGYLLFLREGSGRSLVLLAAYSGSGLVGFVHYSVPGATNMPWWRQTHIILDIACGLAILAFAVWASRRARAAVLDSS